MDYGRLRSYLDAELDHMVGSLEKLVSYESPSTDPTALSDLAMTLAETWREVGAGVELIDTPKGSRHIRVVYPDNASGEAQAPALLVGHFDTVWPVGTLGRRPFKVDGGRATGPGVCDMKGGLVIAEYALRAIAALKLPLPRPIVLAFNSDEETGSATSRSLIEREARQAAYALVLEPAVPGGALKTARKGVGAFELRVAGRASHAGAAPEQGVSAIEELAHQILRLHAMTDLDAGTTVNVGVIEGGSRSNVVAAQARARVDARAWTVEEASRLEGRILGLTPVDPRTQVTVTGGFGRPPLERAPGTVHLFEVAQRLGRALGMDLEERSSGGGSDGNFTAALGVPTLDGLGAVGDGSHAEHEYVEVASLPQRASLLAALLCEL